MDSGTSSRRRAAVGQRLGRYELTAALGAGAMGAVYRARDPNGQREVAIKVLLDRGALTARARERLRREGAALAALRHPGILAIHDMGEHQGLLYLVLELVPDAIDLEQAFARSDRRRRVELVRDVARAAGAAHTRGIVHRDLKPANVLVGGDGVPRLSDFGLALSDQFERLTQSGALLGTPLHMAPEQVRGARDAIGPATDVWALGTLLYEALTNTPAFVGDALPGLLAAIIGAHHTPPRKVDPTISPALAAVVAKALAPDPSARYVDGVAFANALDQALSQPAPPRTPPSRWIAAALGLVLLGAAGAAALTPDPQPAPASRALPATVAGLEAWLLDDPNDAEAWVALGKTHLQGNDLPRAAAAAACALELTDRHEPHYILAIEDYQAGDPRAALVHIEAAVAAPGGDTDADAWTVYGDLLRACGRSDDALRACQRALELDPDSSSARNNLAIALASKGELERAVELLRGVIAEGPDDQSPYFNLAYCLAQQQLDDQALAAARDGLTRFPDDAELHAMRAECLGRLGRPDEAELAWDRAIELEPTFERILSRARARLELGRRRDAVLDLDAARRLADDSVVLLDQLHPVYQQANHPDGMLDCARRQAELEPTAKRYNLLALILEHKAGEAIDRPEYARAALEAYARALELASPAIRPVVLANRGELRLRMHDARGAADDLRRCLAEVDPDGPHDLDVPRRLLAEAEARLAAD